MITIAICGLFEVPYFSHSTITDIVSIGDVGMQLPDLAGFASPPTIHRFEFSDICHVAESGDKDVSPAEADVQRLLDLFSTFLARMDYSRILFHCTAGRARSTAAAFVFCVLTGMTYEDSFRRLVRIRGPILPNLLMIAYADKLMGHEGRMLDFIATQRADAPEWVRRYREVTL